MIRLSATAFAFACLALPLAAQETDPDALASALVGNTFQGDMAGGGYASYFGEDMNYYDESGAGPYEITAEGVCYPESDAGCFGATVEGTALTWFKDGEPAGSGEILEGDALGLGEE